MQLDALQPLLLTLPNAETIFIPAHAKSHEVIVGPAVVHHHNPPAWQAVFASLVLIASLAHCIACRMDPHLSMVAQRLLHMQQRQQPSRPNHWTQLVGLLLMEQAVLLPLPPGDCGL